MTQLSSERKPAYVNLNNRVLHSILISELKKAAWIEEKLTEFLVKRSVNAFFGRTNDDILENNNYLSKENLGNIFKLLDESGGTSEDPVSRVLFDIAESEILNADKKKSTNVKAVLILLISQICGYLIGSYEGLKRIVKNTNRLDVSELLNRNIIIWSGRLKQHNI